MKAVEIFAGAGGFSLGLKQAGVEVLAAYDFEPRAIAVHEANLARPLDKLTGRRRSKVANLGRGDAAQPDLGDLLAAAPRIAAFAPDLIVGGPPCQPWSSANKNTSTPKGEKSPNAALTEAFSIIVTHARPRFFVMENVPRLRSFDMYRRIREVFHRAGYGLTEAVVDASWYGVGQARRRLLLCGCLGEDDGWLLDHIEAAKQPRRTSVADVLGPDFGAVFFRRGHNDGERRSIWLSAEPSPTITSGFRRRAGQKGYKVRKADRETYERLNDAGKAELRRAYWQKPGGKSSRGTRDVDQPAPTFLGGALTPPVPSYELKEGDVLHPSSLPIMTIDQMSLIAGFPSDWNWSPAGSDSAKTQMIANAVAPPVGRMIATCIQDYAAGTIPQKEVRLRDGYKGWLEKKNHLTDDAVAQLLTDTRAVYRLLGQRELEDLDHALARLKKVPAFAACKAARRSNLVRSLRYWVLHEEYRLEVAREGRIRRYGADISRWDFYGPKEQKAKGKVGDVAAVG
ncbi:DNA cytosine methyltransferase [Aureimonas sp. AU40]|uniref:DNA cytosine methyltransferase n=1 Tax=Aureimonas sp. AU40 TaxID=1637747 RepID=UPI00078257B0|nr:DNA cytosine methyltransferase [Aureimonas sp. AU40]